MNFRNRQPCARRPAQVAIPSELRGLGLRGFRLVTEYFTASSQRDLAGVAKSYLRYTPDGT